MHRNIDGIFVKESADAAILHYPAHGNNDSFEIEERSLWFMLRNRLLTHLLKANSERKDFLDIGGGNGLQVIQFQSSLEKGNKIILCEPSLNGCKNAKDRGVDLVYNCQFEDFPFDQYDINCIGLFDVLEHIEDDSAFLERLFNKLKSGTKVYITVPAHKHLFSEIDIYSGHFRRYNRKELVKTVSNSRFKLDFESHFFSFYYLPLLILRVISYRLGLKSGESELVSQDKRNHDRSGAGLLKFLFSFINRIETALILNRVRLPFGTSMLAVLSKH